MKTWILCPSWVGARLFVLDDRERTLQFERELRRPLHQAHTHQPLVHEYVGFIDHLLTDAHANGEFDKLILCAEPALLNRLIDVLDEPIEAKLLGTVEVDLYDVNETDLLNYIRDFLEPSIVEGLQINTEAFDLADPNLLDEGELAPDRPGRGEEPIEQHLDMLEEGPLRGDDVDHRFHTSGIEHYNVDLSEIKREGDEMSGDEHSSGMQGGDEEVEDQPHINPGIPGREPVSDAPPLSVRKTKPAA